MYKRVLIANRSDCALRLIRACHYLGIEIVLISSRDEPSSLAMTEADNIYYTGMSRDAYYAQDNILDVAREMGCEAILPGWGFLSESYQFARRIRLAGLDFVGPRESHMQIFGDKLATLDYLVPLLKTQNIYQQTSQNIEQFLSDKSHNFAWMLEGKYGGGGKSVFLYSDVSELKRHVIKLKDRNETSHYYIEKAILGARHIEFQIFGLGNNGTHVIGIRDCTHQKNQQKWLEYHLNPNDLNGLHEISEKIQVAFSALRYEGWGTVEFLYDRDGMFHLLEVNPRLQVEHGVTEMAMGIDLVGCALKWSNRRCISLDRSYGGIAMEFRLYAQSVGKIEEIGFDGYTWPEHAYIHNRDYRLETGYLKGDVISGVYDGCLARFIVSAGNAPASLEKLRIWLNTFHCSGVKTNLADLASVQTI